MGQDGVQHFAGAVVAEGGAGILEGHRVGGVRGREEVTGGYGVFHVHLPVLAAGHRLLVLDLRLRAPHPFELGLGFEMKLQHDDEEE